MHIHHAQAASGVLARARFNEEQLDAAFARGVAQYVILGAGLDTFAWRRPDLADQIQIFELDHPSSQEFKRARLAAAGMALPANLHFGAADFERETVADVLSRLPFDLSLPSHFALLGVSNYLTVQALRQTLTATRSCATPGSQFVLDYMLPEFVSLDSGNARVAEHARTVANMGEPFLTGFTPEEFRREMQSLGWDVLEDLGPDAYGERYFRGRSDGFWPSGAKRLAWAQVLEERRSEP